MPETASFRAILDLWPDRGACALDIGATPSQVSKWWQRDNIPSEWWDAILNCRLAEQAGVTAAIMARLAARKTTGDEACAEARP